jgi:hypothetical protein
MRRLNVDPNIGKLHSIIIGGAPTALRYPSHIKHDETAIVASCARADKQTTKGGAIMAKSDLVPPDVLDAALRAVKATLPRRSFENYKPRDWEEVRKLLPAEYRHLSDEKLERQATNRRKRAVYSTDAKKRNTKLWAEVKKAVKKYWSDTNLKELGDRLTELKSRDGPG